MTANKYNAQRCEYDGINFDSLFERDVYLELRRYWRKCQIEVHYPVIIAPPNEYFPKGWYHRVDFYVQSVEWYIEAKGAFTAEYKQCLRGIAALNPGILKRYTVVTKGEPVKVFNKFFSISEAQLKVKLQNCGVPPITH